MSRTVDERVVSMQFDNKQFEKNVSTSMSTLDKLKEKLNLNGAAKGLENVNSAAKKVDLSNLSNSANAVSIKFSAMQIAGVTAIQEITKSAMAAGNKLVKSLSVDQITSGWDKYSKKTASVQTIMNSTGKSIDEVNGYLEKLMWFSDETSYSFTDMTNALATMTSTGGDINKLIPLITGVANATSFAGKGAAEFSRVLQYGINQAYSLGYMQVQDWKTIEGATVNSKQLLETLISVGEELGKIKKGEVTVENFRSSLADKWLDTDVMEEGFGRFAEFSQAVYEAVNSGEYDTASEAIEALSDKYSELGVKAFASAQEAKTFTEAIEATKDAVSTGWMKTFEIIFGNYEEAKKTWTSLANWLWDIFASGGDVRNAILESAFGKNFTELGEKISGIISPATKAVNTVKEALKDYNELVNEIINGEWGNGQARWNKLTEAGYDWAHAQNLVNEKLGSSVRHTTNYSEAQNKQLKTTEKLTEEDAKLVEQLVKLSDTELKAKGYSDDKIKAFRELEKVSDKLGLSISDLIVNIDEIDGKWLFLNSFKNIGTMITGIIKSIKDAWVDIFPEATVENIANKIFDIIAAIHKFTAGLKLVDDKTGELNSNGEKLKRTFKGIFALLDTICTIIAGPIKIAFTIFKQILEAFDLNILDVTASIGDLLVKFRDWIDEHNIFVNGIKKVIPYIEKFTSAIKKWYAAFKESDFYKSASNIIQGLIEGIKGGASKVWNAIVTFAKGLLEKLNNALGIHSPSTETKKSGINFVEGFIVGIKETASKVWAAIKSFAGKAVDFVKGIDWGKVFAGVLGGGTLAASIFFINKGMNIADKFADFLKVLASPIEGLGNMLKGLGSMFTGIGKSFEANVWEKKSNAILNIAKAIGVLALSLIALTFVNTEKLWEVIPIMGLLVGYMASLIAIANLTGGKGSSLDFGIKAGSIIAIAASILIVASAMKKLGDIEPDKMGQTLTYLVSAIGGIVLIVWSLGKVVKADAGNNIDTAAVMILKISIALYLMTKVIKAASKLDGRTILKGIAVIAALEYLVMGLIAVSTLAGENASKAGSMLLKISVALLIMVGVVKLAGHLDKSEIKKGLSFVAGVELLFIAIIAVSKLAGQYGSKAGGMMLKMSLAILVMTYIVKEVSKMDDSQLKRGLKFVASVEALFIAIIAVSKLAGKNAAKAGAMLLMMSGALLIVTLVMYLLSKFDPEELKRSLTAISIMEGCFAGLIAVTHLAKDSKDMKGVLISLIVAIGVLTLAIFLLSRIEPSVLANATGALTAVMGVFSLMIFVTKYANDSKQMIKTLYAMLGVVAILGLLIAGLTLVGSDSAMKSAAALSLVMLSFSAALFIMSRIGNKSKTVSKQILPMLEIVAGIAIILGLMSAFKVEGSLKSASALSLLLMALATSLVIMSKAGRISTTVSKQIYPMLGVIAGLGLILGLMSAFNAEGSYKSALAIGILLNLMATSMVIMGKVGRISKSVSSNLYTILGVVAGLGLILGLMDGFNVEGSITTAIALGILLNAMAVSMLILDKVKSVSGSVLGSLAIIGLVVAEIGAILGIMQYFNIMPSIEIAVALSTLLLAMSAACLIVSRVPAAAAIQGALGLAGFVAIMGVLVAAIGGLAQIPGFNQLIKDGGETLGLIGYAIGNFVRSIIGGIAAGLSSGLPEIGKNLSEFIINATPFIVGIKMVDSSMLEGIGILAATIIALTAADFINSIASFLTGGSSFADLGTQLSQFMINAMPFIVMSSTIRLSMLDGVRALADAIMILTAANFLDGISRLLGGGSTLEQFSWKVGYLGVGLKAFASEIGGFGAKDLVKISCAAKAVKTLAEASAAIPNTGGLLGAIVGNNDLGAFSDQFPNLGSGLRKFARGIGTFTDAQVTTVECAAKAIKILAEASSEIPNTGGLIGDIVGNNDLGTFADQFPVLGTGLAGFLTNVGTFTDAQVKTVECAANAIKLLAEASSKIPNTGGLLGAIVGENDLGNFADQFPKAGTGLAGFVENIGTFSEEQMATVESAANAVKILAQAAAEIPNSGGWLADIVGDNDLGAFADQFPKVGTGLAEFAENLGTFSESELSSINTGIEAVKVISELAGFDLSVAQNNINTFGSSLSTFGEKLADFCEKLSGIDLITLTTAINRMDILIDVLDRLEGVDTTSAKNFKDAINELGKTSVKKFIDSFTDSTSATDVKSAATTMLSNFIEGAESKGADVDSALETIATNGKDAIKTESMKEEFRNAGKYLGDGLIEGINAKKQEVYRTAWGLGRKAVQGELAGQVSSSPSKLTIQAGKWFGEGLVIGIDKMGKAVYSSGHNLGETAVNALSSTISRISDAVSTDIDAQPTIRPVLDLSDVRSGAGAIEGMLGVGSSIGVMSRVGAISSSMNRINQNGVNDDVVSAINKLRKDLSNVGGNSYTINGLTYDDGSNISDAVKAIVRAAKVERRI